MPRPAETEFFDIDKNALDREWVRQPKLYHEYAVKLEMARADLERAKTNIDVVRADLDRRIRKRPDRFGLKKITEPAVTGAIDGHTDYHSAVTELEEARHKVGMLQAAVSTLDHKKKALEMLVQLFLADYFSEPRTSGDARRVIEETGKRRARRPIENDT